jgi:hypothetical protein
MCTWQHLLQRATVATVVYRLLKCSVVLKYQPLGTKLFQRADLAAFVAKSNCVEQHNLYQYLYFGTFKASTFVLVSVACHDFAAVDDQFEALQTGWLDL